ncbi:hypothetical protein CDAR_213581 [Caerostris darwini]|uniref:Uncharacterized protein n=1 Tax=Caerostris darwini TaxID=1538125 RepID=A0AAV4T3L4_9ARAC|nr:hypothetical protein CDAR_213581 [Caerostris darwini]
MKTSRFLYILHENITFPVQKLVEEEEEKLTVSLVGTVRRRWMREDLDTEAAAEQLKSDAGSAIYSRGQE